MYNSFHSSLSNSLDIYREFVMKQDQTDKWQLSNDGITGTHCFNDFRTAMFRDHFIQRRAEECHLSILPSNFVSSPISLLYDALN